jgi:hypothetical protein
MRSLTTLIVAVGMVVASCALYVFMYAQIAEDIERIARAVGSAETLFERDASIRGQQIFLEENKDALEQLRTYLVTDGAIIETIEFIETAGANTAVDVSISSVNTRSQEAWSAHEAVDIAFSARGDFASIAQFTGLIESFPLASRVERLVFEKTTDEWFASFSIVFVKLK